MLPIENYVAPKTFGEAVEIAAHGEATIIAGGTIVMPQTLLGTWAYKKTLLNLRRIEELRGVVVRNERVRIGATTIIRELAEHDLIKAHAPILVDAAHHVGNTQLRNLGTVGGNLCNGSPSGDLIVPLLLLDAEVELASWSGGVTLRTIPLREFFTGPEQTVRRANEILQCVSFTRPRDTPVGGFLKFGRRVALDVTIASVGLLATSSNGSISDLRIAFGGVAPTPMRGLQTEAVLAKSKLDDAGIAAAAAAAHDEVQPISDDRASAWYRRKLIAAYTTRLLSHVSQL